MKQTLKRHGLTILIAAVVAAVTAGGPVIARTVADFARNAHRVDGRHAVGAKASAQKRAGKLVATNKRGFLPNNIIRKAPNAALLGHRPPEAYALECGRSVLRGHALVTPEIGSEYEEVPGFATLHGPPIGPSGSNCSYRAPTAKRVATGTYRTNLASVFSSDCPDGAPERTILGATVTVIDEDPAIATYVPVCEGNLVVAQVHITDSAGSPSDASFAIALFDEHGLPIP